MPTRRGGGASAAREQPRAPRPRLRAHGRSEKGLTWPAVSGPGSEPFLKHTALTVTAATISSYRLRAGGARPSGPLPPRYGQPPAHLAALGEQVEGVCGHPRLVEPLPPHTRRQTRPHTRAARHPRGHGGSRVSRPRRAARLPAPRPRHPLSAASPQGSAAGGRDSVVGGGVDAGGGGCGGGRDGGGGGVGGGGGGGGGVGACGEPRPRRGGRGCPSPPAAPPPPAPHPAPTAPAPCPATPHPLNPVPAPARRPSPLPAARPRSSPA